MLLSALSIVKRDSQPGGGRRFGPCGASGRICGFCGTAEAVPFHESSRAGAPATTQAMLAS